MSNAAAALERRVMLALMPFFHCDLSVDRILMLYGCDSDFVLHVRCMLSLETPEAEPEARQNFVKLVASEAEDCAVAGDAFYFDSRQTSVVIYSNGNVAYLFAVVYYNNGVLVERPFFPVGPQQAYANGEPGILLVINSNPDVFGSAAANGAPARDVRVFRLTSSSRPTF